MRVLTLNVQGFREGRERVASLIRELDPDVVTLNEAFRGETKKLARETDRFRVFASVDPLRGFGNAILLRTAPRDKRHIRFKRTRGFEPRGAAVARVDDGTKIVSVHLGLDREERMRHAVQLVDALQYDDSVVLGGDFNEGPERPAVELIAASYRDAFGEVGEGEGETYPVTEPRYRLDYVFCSRDLKPVSASVVRTVVSDHLGVLVEIDRSSY
jgi:endonuclease/exonuclease/phosphatase family metal-dependent hydrolase